MIESTAYRLSYATDDYGEEHNDRARRAMEQLHGAVNAPVNDENDVQQLVSRFHTIMEAATCVADTLCQGNEETGKLMIQELDRMGGIPGSQDSPTGRDPPCRGHIPPPRRQAGGNRRTHE